METEKQKQLIEYTKEEWPLVLIANEYRINGFLCSERFYRSLDIHDSSHVITDKGIIIIDLKNSDYKKVITLLSECGVRVKEYSLYNKNHGRQIISKWDKAKRNFERSSTSVSVKNNEKPYDKADKDDIDKLSESITAGEKGKK